MSRVKNVHHFVFCPKYRRPILSPEVFDEVKKHIGRICELKGIGIVSINTDPETQDHIHLLLDLPKTMSPSKAMSMVKGYSSTYTRKKYPEFRWQRRYGSESIGSNKRRIKKYIENQ